MTTGPLCGNSVVTPGAHTVGYVSGVERKGVAERGESLMAVAALICAYGVGEVARGYGFLAVFVCAMTFRSAERSHDYHAAMHEVTERLDGSPREVLWIKGSGGDIGSIDRSGFATLYLDKLRVLGSRACDQGAEMRRADEYEFAYSRRCRQSEDSVSLFAGEKRAKDKSAHAVGDHIDLAHGLTILIPELR